MPVKKLSQSLLPFIKLNRQEAAGALWNLSFDDRNREAIAAVGGVEALVCPFYFIYLFVLTFFNYSILIVCILHGLAFVKDYVDYMYVILF